MSDITTTQEAYIHAFVGAQYGDLEFDVGKSVRWTQWFSDDVFILDINTGDPRYWIVNWTLTFPEATHSVTGINYFVDPAAFRKDQFARALKEPAILLEDNDWVLFVDASEGMSCDSRSLPDDVATEPFRSYVFREITRAIAAGRDNVVFPFFAFLRHAQIANVEYLTPALQGAPLGFATVQQSIGVPYYLPNLGMARLWKVSSLKAAGFDWTKIDQPQAIPDPAVKLQLVSYAYAHWNEQDIVPPATTVEALNATNDEGWRMRQLISRIRPLSGLPFADPWKDPALDAGGDAGPWAGDQTGTPDVGTFNDGYLMTTDGYATGTFNADILRFQLSDEPWTIWMKLRLANVSANQLFVGQGVDTADEKGWAFGFIGGRYVMQVSLDGLAMTTLDLGSVASLGLTNNTTFYLGAVYSVDRDLDTYSVQAVKSVDGSVWTSVGPAATGPAFDPWRSIANMLVPPQTTPMQGFVYTIEALDSRNGGTVWRFDADDSAGAVTWEDPSATQWTVTDPLGGSLVGIPGYLNTNTGWVSTPDTVDLSIEGNVRWTARVRRDTMPVPPATTFRFLEQHMGSVTGHSWIERNDNTGTMQIRVDSKAAGVQASRAYWSAAQTAQASPLDTDAWIGTEVIATPGGNGNGTWYGLVSTDGATWTRLGTPTVENRPFIPQDPDGSIQYVGGNTPTTKWPGRIYWMQMTAINRARIVIPGTGGNFVSIPHDAVTQQIASDFEFVARVQYLAGVPGGTVTAKNGSWYMWLNPTTISTGFTISGVGSTFPSSAVHNFVGGNTYWIKVVRVATTGLVSFYTAPDSLIEPTSWTKLGSDVAGTPGALAFPPQVITVGIYSVYATPLKGRVQRVICRNGVGATTPQLVFSGLVGNHLTLPSSTGLNVTDDFEIVMRLAPNDWRSPVLTRPFARYASGVNQQGFAVQLASGYPGILVVPAGGSFTSLQASIVAPFTGTTVGWMKITRRSSDGRVQFFTAADAATEPTSWTQLGVDVIGPIGALNATTAPLMIGGYWTNGDAPFSGRVLRAILRNGIGGTVVADVNESNTTAVGQTSFAATIGGTVTVAQRPPLAFIFPGTAGSYLTIPDAAPLNITGDIEIVVRMGPTDWTPAAIGAIVGKDSTGSGARSWYLRLDTGGVVSMFLSTDGAAQVFGSSSVLPGVDGLPLWIKVTRVAATGLISFYSAADAPIEPTTWTARGTSSPGAGNLTNGTHPVRIGGRLSGSTDPYTGRITRAIVRNGIAGTTVLDVNENNATLGATTFTATAGGTVTVTQTGTVCAADAVTPWWGPIVRGPYFDLNENDAGTMLTASTFGTTLGGTATVSQSNKFVFPGVLDNYMWMPDAAALRLAGSFELVVRAQIDWQSAVLLNTLVARFATTGNGGRSWYLYMDPAFPGRPRLTISTDGSTTNTGTATNAVPFATEMGWLKATYDAPTGTIAFYTAPDAGTTLEPTTWTKLGGDRTGQPTSMFAGTARLTIGRQDVSDNGPLTGRVSRFILRNAIGGTIVADLAEHQSTVFPSTTVSAIGGNATAVQTTGNTIIQLDTSMPVVQPQADRTVWRFDANDYPVTGGGLVFTDPRGRTWTMSAAGAITPFVPVPALVMGWVTPATVPPPTAATAGVLVPLYDTVFRINLRDGVWYDKGQLGNVPLIWNDATQTWDPVVSPEDWARNAFVQVP